MSKVDESNKHILESLRAKFWDFPSQPDEMRVTSYDADDNPLVIEYYRQGRLMFEHNLTYDVDGRITVKKLILK
jgi:hypothetical protein